MASSPCEILKQESERFIDYILSDPYIRQRVFDKESLVLAVRKSFKSDSALANIVSSIDSSGDDLSFCLDELFNTSDIQKLIENNKKQKETEIKQKLKRQRPRLKGKKLSKEIQRRLKQSIGGTKSSIKRKKPKQITIQEATKPVRVDSYKRDKKTVKKYRRTKARDLTKAEEMLIKNNLKKKPSKVVEIYYRSGLKFRSEESIRKHYYRIKWKKQGKTVY